jgi:hypothetical protein
MRGALLASVAILLPATAQAKLSPGTGIDASQTATASLTSTFAWTIAKSAAPGSQAAAVGGSATVHWTITTTRSDSGTLGAHLNGDVCVANAGSRATEGLAIQEELTQPPSTAVLGAAAVDVGAKPALDPGEVHCYPYTVAAPAASIFPGATYKATAQVTITNQSCCAGVAKGPSPSATAILPTTPIPIDDSITVTDTNGTILTFDGGGSQGYDQTFDCTGAPGSHTLANSATIQSTGQSTVAAATVDCHAYPQSNALDRPLVDVLNSFGNDCVSFFLDTDEGQSCDFPCIGESRDHHQGLARTPELSDGSIYWFLSHSELSDSDNRGDLMQFRYGGPVDDERVTGAGVTAPRTQILALQDEQHPSDIDFLPDIDGFDSGYLFVAKEYGLHGASCEDCDPAGDTCSVVCTSHKITVYYWEPGRDLEAIGDIVTDLVKPSHILIDRNQDGYYYLIILDNTFHAGRPYRARDTDLFPGSGKGSMNVAAFQALPPLVYTGTLGSQAQLIRESGGAWFVLAYDSDDTDGQGNDFIRYRPIQLGDNVTLGDETDFVHIILPPGETSFTNTGTHYVDRHGRMLISSSERWSHDRGDPFSYESRVDECAPAP